MKVKSLVTTIGLGMAAGAAAVLMMPKHSEVYRKANNAAQTVKHEASRMLDSMRQM